MENIDLTYVSVCKELQEAREQRQKLSHRITVLEIQKEQIEGEKCECDMFDFPHQRQSFLNDRNQRSFCFEIADRVKKNKQKAIEKLKKI